MTQIKRRRGLTTPAVPNRPEHLHAADHTPKRLNGKATYGASADQWCHFADADGIAFAHHRIEFLDKLERVLGLRQIL